MQANHKCAINKEEDTEIGKLSRFQKLRMACGDNPLGLGNFKSDISIRDEQRRHLRVNKRAIHPFSKFKAWYDMFLIYLYLSVLITKPVDAGFVSHTHIYSMHIYKSYTIIVDVFCWISIILNFFIGIQLKQVKTIELRPWQIAKNYLFSSYFICDVLSSVPKNLFYFLGNDRSLDPLMGTISLFGLLKIIRIFSFVQCIGRTAEYFQIKARGTLFLLYTMILSYIVIHWVSCMQFAVPRFVRRYFVAVKDNSSWFFEDNRHGPLYTKSIMVQYTHCFFRGSAYIRGLRLLVYPLKLTEEYVLTIITYFIGKIAMGFIWIILAVAILNARVMNIKFAEMMNQLEEYMRQKQLPLYLRERMLQYFTFKYRGRYFQEGVITGLLSENLRNEASMHACKSLIRNVSLFSELTNAEVARIVEFLVPEIFLPNDYIINAGTRGDAMYFVASGTVAVYTRSGKEICHLSDGAYFGEIALVLKGQLRLTTIIALEVTQVYRLRKKDLERYLLSNKWVMSKILATAEMRFKQTTKLEEQYKEFLFEQSYNKMS